MATEVTSLKGKHLLTLSELTTKDIMNIIDDAIKLKEMQKNGVEHHYLKEKH